MPETFFFCFSTEREHMPARMLNILSAMFMPRGFAMDDKLSLPLYLM